jgi:hypothetical protein
LALLLFSAVGERGKKSFSRDTQHNAKEKLGEAFKRVGAGGGEENLEEVRATMKTETHSIRRGDDDEEKEAIQFFMAKHFIKLSHKVPQDTRVNSFSDFVCLRFSLF